MNAQKFFRRRQFALGPEYFEFPGWKRLEIASDCRLTYHPDLAVTRLENGPVSFTLLGFLVDPLKPTLSEQEILAELSKTAKDRDSLSAALEGFTGRFVIVADLGRDIFVVHDAVGLRQVQYFKAPDGSSWCASQAETLAERLSLPFDKEVLDFRELPAFKGKTEFWLLNNRTPYTGVFTLLPNHILDFRRGVATRFWPRPNSIPRLSVAESVKQCSPLLVNAIEVAARRFDLRAGITAGIDSRKTLAASRRIAKNLYFFSHGITEGTVDVSDVSVPARLLPRLGLKHHVLPLQSMDEEFRKLFHASSTWARDKKGNNAFTLLNAFGPDATVLNSNISEVAQCIYWLPPSHIDGEGLAMLCGLAHPFAVREFESWLASAKPACDAAGMDVLALFFLEQRMGRWAAAAFSEYDIAHETFNPYNNRLLHSLMLAVPERHRRDRMWDVPLQQIKALWPEVLCEPINPQDSLRTKAQQFVRRFIIHKTIASWWSLYPYLRYIKRRRKFRKMQLAAQTTVNPG